jgi:hypothetical protein
MVIRDIVMQMKPGDQFIVTTDGKVEGIHELLSQFDGFVELVEGEVRVGDFGCTPNDRATRLATGDAIWYIGDDDRYPPSALDDIRKAVQRQPSVVHIFSMMHQGRLLRGNLHEGAVSSQQAVVPNRKDLPLWTGYPPGRVLVSDYHWINNVVEHVGRYVFHDAIITVLEQQHYGAAL